MLWIKPSGVEVKTNDRKETIEYCKSLGWKEKGAKKEVKEEVEIDISNPVKYRASKKKTSKKTDK